MDVQTSAGGMARVDLSKIAEDLVPSVTNTYNIGLSDAQWAAIWVAIAIVTSITIGGAIGLSNVDGWLFVNASTQVNGSMNISEDLFVEGNVTADYYIGNASLMDGLPTPDNSSWNESWAATLFANISVTGDNESWNESWGNFLYRLQSWDNLTGIPHATPSDGDITHFSLADEIYDWVIGLTYATTTYVDDLVATYTHLTNFTDDLGNRGYTHLTNFSDDLGNRGYTDLVNFTNSPGYLTSYTETDPQWSGNETNVAFKNEVNVFTENQNHTGQNISTIDCIIFDSGGEICSGS